MDLLRDEMQSLHDCLDKARLKRNPHPTTASNPPHPILTLPLLQVSSSTAFYKSTGIETVQEAVANYNLGNKK